MVSNWLRYTSIHSVYFPMKKLRSSLKINKLQIVHQSFWGCETSKVISQSTPRSICQSRSFGLWQAWPKSSKSPKLNLPTSNMAPELPSHSFLSFASSDFFKEFNDLLESWFPCSFSSTTAVNFHHQKTKTSMFISLYLEFLRPVMNQR